MAVYWIFLWLWSCIHVFQTLRQIFSYLCFAFSEILPVSVHFIGQIISEYRNKKSHQIHKKFFIFVKKSVHLLSNIKNRAGIVRVITLLWGPLIWGNFSSLFWCYIILIPITKRPTRLYQTIMIQHYLSLDFLKEKKMTVNRIFFWVFLEKNIYIDLTSFFVWNGLLLKWLNIMWLTTVGVELRAFLSREFVLPDKVCVHVLQSHVFENLSRNYK